MDNIDNNLIKNVSPQHKGSWSWGELLVFAILASLLSTAMGIFLPLPYFIVGPILDLFSNNKLLSMLILSVAHILPSIVLICIVHYFFKRKNLKFY